MSYAIAVKSMAARPYIGIRRRVKPPEIGPALAEILPAVHRFVEKQSGRPDGPPMTLYLHHDPEAGFFEILGGSFLRNPIAGEGEFEAGVIPAGEFATTLHVGPYERLGEAHEAIERWIAEQGRRPEGGCWETYWTDPGIEKDPGKYRTEVVWRMAPQGG